MKQGYASIERGQRRRVVKVTADVDETVSNANEVRMDLESRLLPELKQHYAGLRYTIEGEGKEQKESLGDVVSGFAVALFCIYALLAIPSSSPSVSPWWSWPLSLSALWGPLRGILSWGII